MSPPRTEILATLLKILSDASPRTKILATPLIEIINNQYFLELLIFN